MLFLDLKHDYTLSDEFRKNHFLVGLLLHEVKMALNEMRDVRKPAIMTLRNLLAKHAFDDRYSSKARSAQARAWFGFGLGKREVDSRRIQGQSSGSAGSQGFGQMSGRDLDLDPDIWSWWVVGWGKRGKADPNCTQNTPQQHFVCQKAKFL